MAVGDDLAAVGGPVESGTNDRRNGYQAINRLGDWLVNRFPLPIPVNKGGTGSTTADGARAKLGIDRIQSGSAMLRIDDTGKLFQLELYSAAGHDNSPDSKRNHLLLVSPDGSFSALVQELSNDYMPPAITVDKVTADELHGDLWSTQARGNSYTGNSPRGSQPGDNRLAVITPAGHLGVLDGELGSDYMPPNLETDTVTADKFTGQLIDKDSYYQQLSAGNSPISLYIDNDGRIGRQPSARKYKEDITPAQLDVDALLNIEPVSYRLTGDSATQMGFIADDFEGIAPQLVIHGEDGAVEGLHYERVSVALYAIVRQQHAQLEQLRADSQKDLHQLARRTEWLYRQITGQPAPAQAAAAAPTEGTT